VAGATFLTAQVQVRQLQHRDGDQNDGQRFDQKLCDRDVRGREHDEDQRDADPHDTKCRHRRHAAAGVGGQKRARGDEDQHGPVLEEKAVQLFAKVQHDGPQRILRPDRPGHAHGERHEDDDHVALQDTRLQDVRLPFGQRLQPVERAVPAGVEFQRTASIARAMMPRSCIRAR
jgi:hypothetical protein